MIAKVCRNNSKSTYSNIKINTLQFGYDNGHYLDERYIDNIR
jgi:hypothetical protein